MRKIHETTNGDRTVKVHRDSETGEYRCRLYVCGKAYEPADYFTDDVKDARATMELMVLHPACENADTSATPHVVVYQHTPVIASRNKREGYYEGRGSREYGTSGAKKRHLRSPIYPLSGNKSR